jgi:hypothetical protein
MVAVIRVEPTSAAPASIDYILEVLTGQSQLLNDCSPEAATPRRGGADH